MTEFFISLILGLWILLKITVGISLVVLGIYLVYLIPVVILNCNAWVLGGVAGLIPVCAFVGHHARWHYESQHGCYSVRNDKLIALGQKYNCWDNAPGWYKFFLGIR